MCVKSIKHAAQSSPAGLKTTEVENKSDTGISTNILPPDLDSDFHSHHAQLSSPAGVLMSEETGLCRHFTGVIKVSERSLSKKKKKNSLLPRVHLPFAVVFVVKSGINQKEWRGKQLYCIAFKIMSLPIVPCSKSQVVVLWVSMCAFSAQAGRHPAVREK